MLNFAALQTPKQDGETLVDPPPDQWRQIVQANRRLLDACRYRVLDREVRDLRAGVRQNRRPGPIILTGHQPEPMHPGVWAKNVVAFRAADGLNASAINLVADTDHPEHRTLAIPSHDTDEVTLADTPISGDPADWAYESQSPGSRSLLDEADRVARVQLGDHFAESLAGEALGGMRMGEANSLGEQWTIGRRAIEASFGLDLEDMFVSRLSGEDTFLLFAGDLISKARRFAEAYNASTADYRSRYGVRSPGRPVPDMVSDDRRVELPLWCCPAKGRRERLFTGLGDDGQIELHGETGPLGRVDPAALENGGQAADAVRRAGKGLIRPRALALTLFGRLIYGDLFIHGIGGAKYDRVTDGIFERFYGIAAPVMACVTATLRLPIPLRAAGDEEWLGLRHRRRDLRFNAQRYFVEAGADRGRADRLLTQRDHLIERSGQLRREAPRDAAERRRTWRAIRGCNERLADMLGEYPNRLEDRLRQIERDRGHNKIAGGREYYFGIYPRAKLQKLLDALPQAKDFG